MTYQELIEQADLWFSQEKPFVLFSYPESTQLFAYFQHSSEKYTTVSFDEKGFVMAPFDYKKTALIIPAAHSSCECVALPEITNHLKEDVKFPDESKGEKKHVSIVEKTIDEINLGEIKKIVISRQKDVTLSKFSLKTLIDQVFTKDYNGLKYVWFHPETAIWCGTTPETLLKLKGGDFSTISLAGTKLPQKGFRTFWSEKEIEEQEIVTHAIFDSLKNITPVLKMSKPYTHQAGSIVHLRTDVTGIVKKNKAKLEKFINALHPTPAVCGMPMEASKSFILENEQYDRQFYTGFLGDINNETRGSHLFVNLRSMQIKNDIASLFVGGGIIKQSNPQEEWLETQNKLQTMGKVVAPML
ncbi:isochorismate synthase entC [unidentified eubacterium SCB49]|nr:isochorismate synthase entC [unidentified eubacterium SCB49]